MTRLSAEDGALVLPTAARLRHRVRLTVEIWHWRNGWLATLALLMVFGCAAAAVATVWVQRDDEQALQQAKQALAELRAPETPQRPDERGHVATAAPSSLASVLPVRDAVTEQVRSLYELAVLQQLNLTQAEFSYDGSTQSVRRMRIVLPIKATYPQLRRFSEASLRQLPNLSLDGMSFKRGQVGEGQVDAVLRVSIWYRDDGHERMPGQDGRDAPQAASAATP